jgi:transcriptional regulator with XRE-family HTH domain
MLSLCGYATTKIYINRHAAFSLKTVKPALLRFVKIDRQHGQFSLSQNLRPQALNNNKKYHWYYAIIPIAFCQLRHNASILKKGILRLWVMDGQAIKDALGKTIKFLRFRRGLSQADLAEKANISITFLSTIERGIKFPQPDILSKLANALDVEVFELFKADFVPSDSKVIISQLSEDIAKNVNLTIADVFRQYLG